MNAGTELHSVVYLRTNKEQDVFGLDTLFVCNMVNKHEEVGRVHDNLVIG